MYKQPSMTKPAEAFEVKSTPLPPTLEWGQVLINVKAASIGPGDIHPLFASSMDPATRRPCLTSVRRRIHHDRHRAQ